MRVHAPMIAPSALTAMLIVFVDVMKELPATLMLRPFDFDTLAVAAHNYAADERLGHAAAPSLAIVAAGDVPCIILIRSISARRRGHEASALLPRSGPGELPPACPVEDFLRQRLILSVHGDIDRVALEIAQRLSSGVSARRLHRREFVVAHGEDALALVARHEVEKADRLGPVRRVGHHARTRDVHVGAEIAPGRETPRSAPRRPRARSGVPSFRRRK